MSEEKKAAFTGFGSFSSATATSTTSSSSSSSSQRNAAICIDDDVNEKFFLFKGNNPVECSAKAFAVPVDLRMRATSDVGDVILTKAQDAAFLDARRREMAMGSEHPFGRPSTGSQISVYSSRLGKTIMHVVVPRYNESYRTAYENALHTSYLTCLTAAVEVKARSIAIVPLTHKRNAKGYAIADATHIAMRTIRCFLEKHHNKVEAVHVLVGDAADESEAEDSYHFERLRAVYFPATEEEEEASRKELSSKTKMWVKKSTGERVISERAIRIGKLPGVPAMTPPEKWRKGNKEAKDTTPLVKPNFEREYAPPSGGARAVDGPEEDAEEETSNPITFEVPSFETISGTGSLRNFTRYTVVMKDAEILSSWTAKKRYSEFDAFRKSLGEFAADIPFPKKTFSLSLWGSKDDSDCVSERQIGLCQFLNDVIAKADKLPSAQYVRVRKALRRFVGRKMIPQQDDDDQDSSSKVVDNEAKKKKSRNDEKGGEKKKVTANDSSNIEPRTLWGSDDEENAAAKENLPAAKQPPVAKRRPSGGLLKRNALAAGGPKRGSSKSSIFQKVRRSSSEGNRYIKDDHL